LEEGGDDELLRDVLVCALLLPNLHVGACSEDM
jgi:hypothetical protein